MIQSAITLSLVPEARGGPFVFWDDLASGCAQAAAHGFDAIEIFPRAAEELNARELKRLLSDNHLRLAAMGTGAGWIVQRLRLTEPEASVRRQAQQFISSIIDFAAGFGAPAIVGSMQGRAEPGVSREQALEWLSEALEQLGPRAHAAGVPLLFEPLNRYETNLVRTIDEGIELLRPLRTKNIRLLADLFHMNIEEISLAEALRRAGPLLGHVHFADSNRHAAGFGHTDFAPAAEALLNLGYSGHVSAEILPLPDGESAAQQTMIAFQKYFPRA
ncbi:MAG: hypothetical protein QOF48_3351 [Verrucomicrobiota bacterium]